MSMASASDEILLLKKEAGALAKRYLVLRQLLSNPILQNEIERCNFLDHDCSKQWLQTALHPPKICVIGETSKQNLQLFHIIKH